MSSPPPDLLQRYHLSESDVLQPVSNIHLQKISRSHCRKWRSLPVALDMENHLIWEDIELEVRDEEMRRNKFFSRWQSEKGAGANYKSLINALLVIGCRQDAEYVCELLNKTATRRESADKECSDQSDELVKENFARIKGCFATLVDKVAMKLSAIDIDMERFQTFIANLYPPGDFISKTSTIMEIFNALTHKQLWNYSSYSTFLSIYKEFGKDDPELKKLVGNYKAELAGFKATTRIIDFIETCDCLNSYADSEQSLSQYKGRYDRKYCQRLTVKIGRPIKEEVLEYVDEFWKTISDFFLLPSLPVLLESINKGCIEITWLISKQSAFQIESKLLLDQNLFQQDEITRVTLEGRILYETEPLADELQRKLQIYKQELKIKDREIEMLKATVQSRNSIIKMRDECIIRMQNELMKTKEQLQDALQELKKLNILEFQILEAFEETEALQLDLTWEHGPDMPFDDDDIGCLQSVMMQGKAYFGGGSNVVKEYNTSSKVWDTLIPYETTHFAMAGISNHLVLVGGYDENGDSSKVLGIWESNCKSWMYHLYPQMPMGRYDCSTVVYGEWLVVAGGKTDLLSLDNTDLCVDVLNTESKQWFAGPPLPRSWSNMNTAVVQDTCYFIRGSMWSNEPAYSVSAPTLIDYITSDPSTEMDVQIWKEIAAPPNECSFPLSLNKHLYAVGGLDNDDCITATTAIHLYQPDREEWLKVGDLLSPRYFCACAMITNREMLVVGGYDDNNCVQKRTDIAIIKCF